SSSVVFYLFFFFFLLSFRYHLYLHSFPTRRSSDLFLNSTLSKSQQKTVKTDLLEGRTKMLYVAPETLTKQENITFFSDINISFRSEEHTSELQSRENLVCRLLLEKKKKIY